MRPVLTRIFFSFLIAVTAVLVVAVGIAKLVSLMRGPHEAAAGLESAIGDYWPLMLVAILVLTIGLSALVARRWAPERHAGRRRPQPGE